MYSLGVLLFEMLTGRRPYPETTWDELTAVTRHGFGPKPDGTPAAVADMCSRMLAAVPADRPSVAECRQILDAALSRRRHGRLVAVAVAVAAGTAIAVAAVLDPTFDPGEAAPGPAEVTAEENAVPTPGFWQEDGATSDPGNQARESKPNRPAERSGPEAGGTPSDPAFVALEAFVASLDEALAAGDVRPDVHLDLEQVATNLYWDKGFAADGAAQLRNKLDDRYREGTVTRAVWDELHADVDAIAAAVD